MMLNKTFLEQAVKITAVMIGGGALSGVGLWTSVYTVYSLSNIFPLTKWDEAHIKKHEQKGT
jgi:hypothetical protein